MTIGPAPMIMIDLMSVRLGMVTVATYVIPGRPPQAGEPGLQTVSQRLSGFRVRPSAVPERPGRPRRQAGETQRTKKDALFARVLGPPAGLLRPRARG